MILNDEAQDLILSRGEKLWSKSKLGYDTDRGLFRYISGTQFGRSLIALLFLLSVLSACSDDAPTLETSPDQSVPVSEVPTVMTERQMPELESRLEVRDIDAWLNGDATTIAELTGAGKVVLVDFWTYTCVNCLRTLPFLREWHAKYADRGLTILGVHSPEFEFEKELDNVKKATEDESIGWLVALDNEMRTWRAFRNRYWPAKYLIGADHELLYSHFGEGSYRETELKIREALTAAGHDVNEVPIGSVDNVPRDGAANQMTRELYGGYERNYSVYGGYAANDEYYLEPNQEVEYIDPGNYPQQSFVLHGLWRNEAEAVVHARQTDDLSDYIALNFIGKSANVVIDPPAGESFRVFVQLDERALNPTEFGEDIESDARGNTFFEVDEGRMYKIVELPNFGSHILKLSSDSDAFAIFAFTFGVYSEGF